MFGIIASDMIAQERDIMTIGIATADDKRIYLAIEQKGLGLEPGQTPHPLSSKLVTLPGSPPFALLVAGGSDHWYEVKSQYQPQPTLSSARDEIFRLLKLHTKIHNSAFCLLCGYENGMPVCYRINKAESQVIDEPLAQKPVGLTRKIQSIGNEFPGTISFCDPAAEMKAALEILIRHQGRCGNPQFFGKVDEGTIDAP